MSDDKLHYDINHLLTYNCYFYDPAKVQMNYWLLHEIKHRVFEISYGLFASIDSVVNEVFRRI